MRIGTTMSHSMMRWRGQTPLLPSPAVVPAARAANASSRMKAEPVIDYLRSTRPENPPADDALEACRECIQQELDRHGAFRIAKETGLFVATT